MVFCSLSIIRSRCIEIHGKRLVEDADVEVEDVLWESLLSLALIHHAFTSVTRRLVVASVTVRFEFTLQPNM